MSELLSSTLQLVRSSPQLPMSWYFDQRIFDVEMQALFKDGPGYVGHELMVPNRGDYQSLAWMDDAKLLVRNDKGIELLANICRHRQAIMLEGRGSTQHIICPLHRWTYNLEGTLVGAPHFPENPCVSLAKTALQNWKGLLFSGRRDVIADLAGIEVATDLDFSGYVYERTEIHQCPYNWKTFIEVYLEDYHVGPFHPGLGQFVNCEDLSWQFADRFSVQTVGINNRLARPGSKTYARWHKAVLDYYGGQMPEHGAIWLTLYPNVMVEWYPHVLVVSTLHPNGPQSTTNVIEFYYPEDIALFEREFVEAGQSAYMETAEEDDEIAIRMDRGRKALYQQGLDDAGPYQSPMEDGMLHFHEHIRRELAGKI